MFRHGSHRGSKDSFKAKGATAPVPVQFDPYLMKLRKRYLFFGNKNPIQQTKMEIVRHLLGKNKPCFMEKPPEKPDFKIGPDTQKIPLEVVKYLVLAGIQAPSGEIIASPGSLDMTRIISIFIWTGKRTPHFSMSIKLHPSYPVEQ